MGWKKATGGGKNSCQYCGGRGEVAKRVARVVTENGKKKTVTETVYEKCTKC